MRQKHNRRFLSPSTKIRISNYDHRRKCRDTYTKRMDGIDFNDYSQQFQERNYDNHFRENGYHKLPYGVETLAIQQEKRIKDLTKMKFVLKSL